MTVSLVVSLLAAITSMAALGGLFLLPKQRRKLMAETAHVEAQSATIVADTGLRALQAALEEAKDRTLTLVGELVALRQQSEIERRLSQTYILQLLDDIRERESKIRERDQIIVRLGGSPPMD